MNTPHDPTEPGQPIEPTAPPRAPGRRRRVMPGEDGWTGEIPVVQDGPATEPYEGNHTGQFPALTPDVLAALSAESETHPEPAPEPAVDPGLDAAQLDAAQLESEQPDAEQPGARRRRRVPGTRRVDVVALLSFVIPLATLGALATVHPADTDAPDRAPGTAPLIRQLLVCPAGLPGSEDVSAAFADPATAGELDVVGADPLAVSAGAVASRRTSSTVVLEGNDAAAVGLFAVRGDADLGTACSAPRSDIWFTGVGSGPEHTSRLRLVNPDSGPAVADIAVLSADGPQEVPALRGLTVAAHDEIVVDLDQVVPARHDMSLHVTVPRGRLALSMTDTFAEIGSNVSARAWLGPQRARGKVTHLLGVESGSGERTLVVANAGADQARVVVRLMTSEGEFVPAGAAEVEVAPGSTTTVDLSTLLAGEQAEGVLGVRLDSEVPVTATLRTVRGKRVQHTVGAGWIRTSAATVVPGGGGHLVLAGAAEDTRVTLRQRTGAGKQLKDVSVEVAAGTATRVDLSSKARTFVLEVSDVPVRAAMVSSAGNPAQVRVLEELATSTSVPQVRPALQ
ncbi:DUF5719 family protein [Nocardioides yefusunii]|uniref:DUF5719 family protein n=1 Tax=Nocardioides yefusunii TaxID=2500546 RepID=A0ABW1R0R9_9ACTN|nr:DUF5719 family protein [Nocardioides yefusunii]